MSENDIGDEIEQKINAISASLDQTSGLQTTMDADLSEINVNLQQIMIDIQNSKNDIIYKIIQCCKQAIELPVDKEQTQAVLTKITTDLNSLIQKSQNIANKSNDHVGLIKQTNTQLQGVKTLLADSSAFIDSFNCEDCSDSEKLKSITNLSGSIAEVIMDISIGRKKAPIEEILGKFKIQQTQIIEILNDSRFSRETKNKLIQYWIAKGLIDQMITEGKITNSKIFQDGMIFLRDEYNNNLRDVLANQLKGNFELSGGRRRESQMRGRRRHKRSLKRPRKRRGSLSSSRRAPPRRTRKYRPHKYAR